MSIAVGRVNFAKMRVLHRASKAFCEVWDSYERHRDLEAQPGPGGANIKCTTEQEVQDRTFLNLAYKELSDVMDAIA